MVKHQPRLGIIMAGETRATLGYIAAKQKAAREINVVTELRAFAEFNFEEIAKQLKAWETDASIDGILVQLPLVGASEQETQELLKLIPKNKDVDGLNPENLAAITEGKQTFLPATVAAVEHILHASSTFVRYGSETWAVVGAKGMVGRSLVDRLSFLKIKVLSLDKDDDLKQLVDCPVVVSCTGVPGIITPEMVRQGAVVIDVGYPTGDVADSVKEKAGFITPVPGGVGPITVAMLLKNLSQTVLASV